MRLPDVDASYFERVRYGRYVGRRLRRAKRTLLASDVDGATAEVLKRGRELEDAEGPVQDARADRDAVDDDVDDVAKDSRAKLAGRSADAAKKPPYTQIFAEGIEYYTCAPLDQQVVRYNQLKTRLTEFLPANDEVRQNAVPALDAGIAAFKVSAEAVDNALTARSVASLRLETAEDAWNVLMTKVYGVLIAELGKAGAERFFPKTRNGKKTKAPT